MDNDALLVPTGLIKDIPGFPKLLVWIATYYIVHVEEMEAVANVEKRRGRQDGGGKRYSTPVC
jgi:hypothetical protein